MARPPRTKLGRTSTGKPILPGDVQRLLHVQAMPLAGCLQAELVDQRR